MRIVCSECSEEMVIEGETIYEHWMNRHHYKLLNLKGVQNENSSISQ